MVEKREELDDCALKERLLEHSHYFESLLRAVSERFLKEGVSLGGGLNKFLLTQEEKVFLNNKKEALKRRLLEKLDPSRKVLQFVKENKNSSTVNKETSGSKLGAELESDGPCTSSNKKPESYPLGKANSIPELRERFLAKLQEVKAKKNYKKDAQKGRSEKKRNRKTAALGNLKLALADNREEADRVKKSFKVKAREEAGKNHKDKKETNEGGCSLENITFNKFEFGGEDENTTKKRKNLIQDLSKAEAKRNDLLKLALTDLKKFANAEEKLKKRKALEMAQGVKQRDDIKLLKRSIRRKNTQKRRSAREWAARREEEAAQKMRRVKKREQNIRNRVEAKRQRRIARRQKKRAG